VPAAPAAADVAAPAAAAETAPAVATVAPLVLPEGAEAELEVADQALGDVFAESVEALAGLQSYRYTTTFSSTSKEGGEPQSGSIEVRGAVASPERQSMTWKDLESGGEFSLIRVGTRAWLLENAEWTELPTMVADAVSQGILVYFLTVGWDTFAEEMQTTSTYAGLETVSNIPAQHYTSTYLGWSSSRRDEVTDAAGDVWIAEDGYPIRYRFAAKTTREDGSRGTILWTMELSDVNSAVTIEAPQVSGNSGD
jgi:hypothetical protein